MSDWSTLRDRLRLTLRPLDTWPGKQSSARERGPYSATLKDTLRVLDKELWQLSAKNIVLQIAFREQDFRLDGLPRMNALAAHPGIILCMDTRYGPLRLAFDGFTRWENNLRAIALHLEHLRLAGLYGVGRDGQQYAGWKALPTDAEADTGFPSAEEAAKWLSRAVDGSVFTSSILNDADAFQVAYRAAGRRLHPDQGGSHEAFLKLQRAAALIRKHHGK